VAVALAALPWMAWVTARELRRGWWAARDLWRTTPGLF
jgi:hypothetical protein